MLLLITLASTQGSHESESLLSNTQSMNVDEGSDKNSRPPAVLDMLVWVFIRGDFAHIQ